jgi:uncharacterized protein (DUF433 family)
LRSNETTEDRVEAHDVEVRAPDNASSNSDDILAKRITMQPKPNVIIRDPEILGGIPVFRGTRVPFKNLLDYLEGGHTLDEFLEEFPSVTRQAAIAALEHAKELVIAQTR